MSHSRQNSRPQRTPPSRGTARSTFWSTMRGSAAAAAMVDWTDASWNWVLGVNLMSVIWGIEIFGPLIEAHGEGGQIVSTASIAGLIAGASPAYNVTKYGVVALSEGLRVTLAPRGIGVSVLCPGIIRTQIMNSRRNLPQRFAGRSTDPPTEGPVAEYHQSAERTGIQWHRSALCRRTGSGGHRK